MRLSRSQVAFLWWFVACCWGPLPKAWPQQNAIGRAGVLGQTPAPGLPKDVYPDSGFRLPLPKREDLDEEGKKFYDASTSPNILTGLRGPSGIHLYSPKVAELERALNQYLRYEAGFSGQVRELAILVTAREANSQFEWTVHEPRALQEGIEPRFIEVVKHRGSTNDMAETEAVIIHLGREMFAEKRVTSGTFARALKVFGPRGMVNLVSLMGNYYGTAGLLAAFDMQLRPDQKPLLPMP